VDPVTVISSTLASIKTATEIAKLLKDADFSLEKAEFKLKLADLVGALADAKLQIVSVQDVVAEKDKTIKELEQQLDLKGKMKYERPFYWKQDDDQKDGPFCQKCYDSNNKLIRLQKRGRQDQWDCLECGKDFEGPGYVPPNDYPVSYDPLGV
jgi:hypothetical protein